VRTFIQTDAVPSEYFFYGPLDTGDVDGDGDPDLLISGVNRELGAGRAFEQRVFLNEGGRFVANDGVPVDLANGQDAVASAISTKTVMRIFYSAASTLSLQFERIHHRAEASAPESISRPSEPAWCDG